MSSKQWQFAFGEWEDAFATFYRLRQGEDLFDDETRKKLGTRAGDDSLVFIVSTDSYTSGYWIETAESAGEPDDKTTIYTSIDEVRKLEARVRRARKRAGNAVAFAKFVK